MLNSKIQKKLMESGREFTKGYRLNDPYMDSFESDQQLKLPQPPIVKAPVTPEESWIFLTKDFSSVVTKQDILELMRDRRSIRIFTGESMSFDQLSFLLWATQGIKSVRGSKSPSTRRTVPSAGARHQFETYMLVQNVDGLKPGAYHYLPLHHALEFLGTVDNIEQKVNDSLYGQTWGSKANLVFYWSMIPYRAEWRYGIYAHRMMLIDLGHIGQAMYTACTAAGLGCCAIGTFMQELSDEIFNLDGEEEYIVYTTPVGTIRDCDKEADQAFYQPAK